MTDLENALNDLQRNNDARELCFDELTRRGFFVGTNPGVARTRFDYELTNPGRERDVIVSVYLPIYHARQQREAHQTHDAERVLRMTLIGGASTIAAGSAYKAEQPELAGAFLGGTLMAGIVGTYFLFRRHR